LPQEALSTKELEDAVEIDNTSEISEISRIKADLPKLQDPTGRSDAYFQREFARWEDITLANLKKLDKARKIISKRADSFAEGLSDILVKEMVRVYDFHIARLKKSKSYTRVKDDATQNDRNNQIEALKERGVRVLKGTAFKNAKSSFLGYSESNMERIHGVIAEKLDQGMNLDDVASVVKIEFGIFYEGQAKTIVRTEFASAMADATYQFGKDLATISKKMRKTWITMDDSHTREDHKDLDQKEIVGNSEEVADIYFEINGSPYLRYPKDEKGDAKAVVNCRCDLIWDVVQWE
jgi:hypothetical protein